MRYLLFLLTTFLLISCWKPHLGNSNGEPYNTQKVWGSKPVYAALTVAKQIQYIPQKQAVVQAGNIYAFGKYIFQVDVGRGIHVIDNTVSSKADRIGFITINGCEQISIKGAYLYTNSYNDMISIDISNPTQVKLVSRVNNAFPDFLYNYPMAEPKESGYYACPVRDSVVIGWVKDSLYTSCYKN